MMHRCQKLRDAARDRDCTMNSPMCNGNPATTTWCHSDHQEHGKGVGLKAHDIFGFFGCSGCHEWYDTESRRLGVSNEERRAAFTRAHDRSVLIIVQERILK